MKFRNKKTGEVIEGSEAEMEAVLTELEKSGEIDEWEEFGNSPSYTERKKFFEDKYGKGSVPSYLSEFAPYTYGRIMEGKAGTPDKTFNLGNLPGNVLATAKDVSTLVPRVGNALISQVQNEWNGAQAPLEIGRTREDVNSPAAQFFLDPLMMPLGMGAKLLGKGVQAASYLGGKIASKLPKIGENAAPVGEVAGAGAAGAAEGIGIDAANSYVNDGEFDPSFGAKFGGAIESLGKGAQLVLQKMGSNYIKSVVTLLMYGNTSRTHISDDTLKAFLAEPKNRELLKFALDEIASGRNLSPFIIDRGKKLAGITDKTKVNAVKSLEGQPMLPSNAYEGGSLMEQRVNKNKALFEDQNTEDYFVKKKFGTEKQDVTEQEFGRDFGDNREFVPTDKKEHGTDPYYKTPVDRDLEDFGLKYSNLDALAQNAKTRSGEMSPEELEMLDKIKAQIDGDIKLVRGYSPDYVINSNKFFGDRRPFSLEFQENEFKPFIKSAGELSGEFKKELNRMIVAAKKETGAVSDLLHEAFNGNERSILERAFTYSDEAPIKVKNGYRDAMDWFDDELAEHARDLSGGTITNSKGVEGIQGAETAKDYVYGTYYAKVMEALKKDRALNPELVTTLYGQAALHNDYEVMRSIVGLLERLGVPTNVIKKFTDVGGNYSMLNKARVGLSKKASGEGNVLNKTWLAPIVPQTGVNLPNIVGYRTQKKNFNLNDLSTTKNPTNTGSIVRGGVYNLGNNRN